MTTLDVKVYTYNVDNIIKEAPYILSVSKTRKYTL